MKDGEVKVEARDSHLRCAVCHGGLEGEPPPCAGCGTVTHADCRSEARGCPTFGCVEAPRRIVIAPGQVRGADRDVIAPEQVRGAHRAVIGRARRADLRVVGSIGAALGLLSFVAGVYVAAPSGQCEPRLGLMAFCAVAFTFMGGWAGAAVVAFEQRATPRVGLLRYWPAAVQLVFALCQLGLAALLSDSLVRVYSSWYSVF